MKHIKILVLVGLSTLIHAQNVSVCGIDKSHLELKAKENLVINTKNGEITPKMVDKVNMVIYISGLQTDQPNITSNNSQTPIHFIGCQSDRSATFLEKTSMMTNTWVVDMKNKTFVYSKVVPQLNFVSILSGTIMEQ